MKNLLRAASLPLLVIVLGISGCARHPRYAAEPGVRVRRPVHAVALHHVFRGALFETMGDPASALIEYQEALLYDSTSSSIYQAVGENYLRLGKVASAIRMLERAVELDTGNTEALRLLSDLYQRSRDYDRVEWALRLLLRREPDDPDVLRNLAGLLVARGRAAEALEIVETAAKRATFGAEDWLSLAEVFSRQGAIDQARVLLERAIREEPSNEEAYLELADVYLEAGDTSAAKILLERTASTHPDFHQVRRRLHDIHVMQGDWAAAIRLLEQEVAEDSSDLGLWLQLGRLLVQRGDTARAESLFAELTDRFPGDPAPYISLAAVHVARGDTEAAIEVLRRGLGRSWSDELADRTRDLLVRRGRTEEALKLVQEWVRRDSSRVPPRLQLADLYLTLGDTVAAEKELESVVSAFPEDWRGYFALGRLLYLRRAWKDALASLGRARQLEDGFPGTWVLMGLAYLRQDSLEQAVAVLREAAVRFPQDAQAPFLLGSALMRLRRPQEAVEWFEKSRALDPEDLDVLLGLAAAYDELEWYDRSDSLYRKVLQLDPNHPTALNNYAYSLSLRGERLQEAFEMAEKALRAEPENGAFLDTMGWILYKMGRYEEALTYIQRASELRTDSADVFEHLGDVLEKLGRLDQAREAWEKALRLDSSRGHLSQKIGGR